MLVRTTNPIESEELGPCAMTEKRKRCPLAQPSLDDGLDSSLKKMRISESSAWTHQAIVHPVMGRTTMASSSIPLHSDESAGWMQQPSHP
jgi:hypothetical protein